jgi:small subunit ribosomal protein S20
MAHHASAEKRNRQRIRRTERNRSIKGAVRTLLKKARAALATGAKSDDLASALENAVKAVDRAASKGVVHAKTAARAKSRLAKAAHKRSKAATA